MKHAKRALNARRRIICAGLFCLSTALGAQAPSTSAPAPQAPRTQSSDWKVYSYPAEGFRAAFPSEPTEQKQSVQTKAGSFELHTYLVTNEAVALYIGTCDYGETVAGADSDAILEGARNGAISKVNGHLSSSSKVTLGGYPGIAFEAEASDSHFFGRIYLAGTVLYQAFVASSPGKSYPDMGKFFDSFQFIPHKSP
jgi:hypothetical protein